MIHFEHMSGLAALGLFVGVAAVSVLLGLRTMAALGPVRKWVAIAARVALLALLVLILAGIRVERQSKSVEVMVLRDVSQSTQLVEVTGGNLRRAVDDYLKKVVADDRERRGDDRVGLISFDDVAYVDAAPASSLVLDARATREQSTGTDVAGAIQLALATRSADNEQRMKRLLLMWDGNQTLGNLDEAIRQASSQGIPIDVMPLQYAARNEVIVERFISPTWRREREPFTIDVIFRSTNAAPVAGNLIVRHQGQAMDLDPAVAGVQPTRAITLQPGSNVQQVRVPALESGGVHQFEAIFEPASATLPGETATRIAGDTIRDNNVASTFTFVRGKGRVLYVDSVTDNGGQVLRDAMARQGIDVDADRTSIDQFPSSLIELQNYDAVILANVRRGTGGLSDRQQDMLSSYVRDTGGGLLMIGGPDTFGAGGWQGSKLESILPLDMDIPATRTIPRGAVMFVLDVSGSMGGQFGPMTKHHSVVVAATLSINALSDLDTVGAIGFNESPHWIFPLASNNKGRNIAAIRATGPNGGTAIAAALREAYPPLTKVNAGTKHVILLTDGLSPVEDALETAQRYLLDENISLSTIGIGDDADNALLERLAIAGGGRFHKVDNASQLSPVFLREATVIRRTLLHEDEDGIAVSDTGGASELVRGVPIDDLPDVYGLVLTTRKKAPTIEVPLTVGPDNDPLLAHWQVGLGKVAAFTSDAHNRWAAQWTPMSAFDKFWSQIVRGIGKPAESADFETRIDVDGDRGRIIVEATDAAAGFQNFLAMRGAVVGPDMRPMDVELKQTRPGVYEADFKAGQPGNYVVSLSYRGNNGQAGVLRSGTVVNTSPEFRDLQSNLAALQRVAEATRGRLLSSFDPRGVSLFTRDGLKPTYTPLPLNDWLLPALMTLVLIDISIRRIAWDWNATKQMAASGVGYLRNMTATRKVETTGTIDALRDVRAKGTSTNTAPLDPGYKFEATRPVSGSLSDVVGGATNKPLPKPKPAEKPQAATPAKPIAGGMGGLLDAKRKAAEEIRRREEGE